MRHETGVLLLTCALALAGSYGCDLLDSNALTVENYFPLAVGSRWQYVTTTEPSQGEPSLHTVYVDSVDTDGWYYTGSGPNPPIYLFAYRYQGSSVIRRFFPQLQESDAMYLGGPIRVGRSWELESSYGSGTFKFTIVSVNSAVSVTAGRFSGAIKVRERTPEGTSHYHWYAPGVGLVKSAGPTMSGTYTTELAVYDVK